MSKINVLRAELDACLRMAEQARSMGHDARAAHWEAAAEDALRQMAALRDLRDFS